MLPGLKLKKPYVVKHLEMGSCPQIRQITLNKDTETLPRVFSLLFLAVDKVLVHLPFHETCRDIVR